MTNNDTAYKTTNSHVIEAYTEWRDHALAIRAKRRELSEAVGRDIWVGGSGYSSHITGFERFESDKDGDLIHHDGCLLVSSRRGQHNGRVVPNLRRKSGKEFAKELNDYTVRHMRLPGMAQMHVYMAGLGMVMGYPEVFLWDGVLYAKWGCDDAPVDEQWSDCPLSEYHLAREQWTAANDDTVSGNEGSA